VIRRKGRAIQAHRPWRQELVICSRGPWWSG